jgi:hypothetical protein
MTEQRDRSFWHSAKKWLIAAGIACLIVAAGFFLAWQYFVSHYQPVIRELAIAYLQQRFDAQVELGDLQVDLPEFSPVQLILLRGTGAMAHVQGNGLVVRRNGVAGLPPMFAAKSFSFDLDIGSLIWRPVKVPRVFVDGMEINVPPKEQRPESAVTQSDTKPAAAPQPNRLILKDAADIAIANLDIANSRLVILPRDSSRKPLEFPIHELHMQPLHANQAMAYQVKVDNPLPPGAVTSQGTFGPWNVKTPADSPMQGSYVFEHADLSVFNAIAGKLDSTGKFTGTLGAISVEGQATVPDFRLKRSGNPVPLTASFEALVDGENGNTTLRPVHARLGKTELTTSGTIMRREKEVRKAILLDVDIPKGDIQDLLRLSMKGDPFLTGSINLKARINIPPLTGKVQEKLILDGRFDVESGHFLSVNVQKVLDELSRRGQGKPSDHSIEDVFSSMKGDFHMEDQRIDFRSLTFGVPGAQVDLHGALGLEPDSLDFHGDIRLQARISDMVTGWKKWIARPIDPFFEKNGAGTFLRIKVGGSSKSPKFGLDR